MKKNCASSWLFTKNFNIYLRSEIDWMLQLRVDVSLVLCSITVQILFSGAYLHLFKYVTHVGL
jgi:hypothetical protein